MLRLDRRFARRFLLRHLFVSARSIAFTETEVLMSFRIHACLLRILPAIGVAWLASTAYLRPVSDASRIFGARWVDHQSMQNCQYSNAIAAAQRLRTALPPMAGFRKCETVVLNGPTGTARPPATSRAASGSITPADCGTIEDRSLRLTSADSVVRKMASKPVLIFALLIASARGCRGSPLKPVTPTELLDRWESALRDADVRIAMK